MQQFIELMTMNSAYLVEGIVSGRQPMKHAIWPRDPNSMAINDWTDQEANAPSSQAVAVKAPVFRLMISK